MGNEKKERRLTGKQKKFVEEYLVDHNGTQAAIRAGYSKKTANEIAAQNLAKVSIKSYLAEKQAIIQKKFDLSKETIIEELRRCGFANITDYLSFDANGVTFRDSEQLSNEQKAAIAEVSQSVTKDGGSMRIKLHNKIDALTKLGEHLGLWGKNEVAPPVSINVQVNIVGNQ